MEAARRQAGSPSFTTIERALIAELGADVAPRAETIRAWHKGHGPAPATMSLELTKAFADYYGSTIADLSVTAADRLGRLLRGNRDEGGAITRRYRRPPAGVAA